MNINPSPEQIKQTVMNFQQVAESFGKREGHLYLMIDPKDHKNVRFTNDKRQAASFKEITALVKYLLANQSVDESFKKEILLDYNVIVKKFGKKKLTGLTKIFFAKKKNEQIEQAIYLSKIKSKELGLNREWIKLIDFKRGLREDASNAGVDDSFSPLKSQFNSFIDKRAKNEPVAKEQETWLDEPFCKFSQNNDFKALIAELDEKLISGNEREQIDTLNQTYGKVCKLYRELHENKSLGGDETTQIMFLILARSKMNPSFISKVIDVLTLEDQQSGVTRALSDLAQAMNYIKREASKAS